MPASLSDIVAWLDRYLRIAEIPDYPNALNGLEVENSGAVSRVVAAVDASVATVAGARGGDLFLTHHGLFWEGNRPITGRRYRGVGTLIRADAALYSAHLPLDLHAEVGNNPLLARALGASLTGRFGSYQGVAIGVTGRLAIARRELVARVAAVVGGAPKLIAGGPAQLRRIGVLTGAGGSDIAEAVAAGCDTLVTGEGAHHTWHDAMELGINVIYAGHYATETFGVQALAARVAARFALPWGFLDIPTGL